jgi:hypothetical protein
MGPRLPFRDGLKSKSNGGKAMTEKRNRESVISEIGDTNPEANGRRCRRLRCR